MGSMACIFACGNRYLQAMVNVPRLAPRSMMRLKSSWSYSCIWYMSLSMTSLMAGGCISFRSFIIDLNIFGMWFMTVCVGKISSPMGYGCPCVVVFIVFVRWVGLWLSS